MVRSWALIVMVVALAVANVASAARDMPAGDKGLADQKNFLSYGGVGSYYGLGDNGIPYGGVGGGVGTNGVPGVPGGLGAGGVIGTTPNGGVGGVVGVIPGGVVGFGGNSGGAGFGTGALPFPHP
ncbi:hypothetical protein C2S52_016086 [Perilla frutescens var. hirtella]|uniref:Uncharacterized protein n=1 Tax=Perilla frutescens var. hirtella TaxID=608512 RepID=A0AAD4PEF3_PERFH|nr:hypothetical protein C2S52_016086 [Perilla frutescens var. hirtella]KAH6815151.1 hypothetical protein C2S51_019971 [Perilla frutescens var. frutescens]KAH6836216.1 hypothetical protein C2S53_001253 [Perilla frutescens var. hirtella]